MTEKPRPEIILIGETVLIGETGGPCSGKTSLTAIAPQKIEDRGRDAYVCMEAATFQIQQGMRLKKAVHEKRWSDVREYQKELMGFQIENEERLKRCARREGRPAVILCDRPLPDSRAYLPEGKEGDLMYEELLREATGLNSAEALDRYAAIIKLTTAADGAEEFYTLENNAARDETPEEARSLDKKIELAYRRHQHPFIIDNSTNFEGKMHRALNAIYHVLGIPEPLEIERKYRLHTHPCLLHFPVSYGSVAIEQIYLRSEPGEETRIRRRTHGNGSTYFITRKKYVRPGVRIETEKMIDWRTYSDLAETRDPECAIIEKDRVSFFYEKQYFELDLYRNLGDSLCVLEIELTDLQNTVLLPPFLDIRPEDEVTNDPRYSNHAIARALAEKNRKKSIMNPNHPLFV